MIIKEISKGITHIEDLPVNDFISTLNSLHEFEITEKLDGAQIIFGIDENGFYTSRETKGGVRIYNENNYPLSFSSVYMRSAHRLLEEALPKLIEADLKIGDQIEAEVLYGEVPNVVPYSADINYLIFLRTTEGYANIDRLKQHLSENTLSIPLIVPFTDDGKNINYRLKENVWKFSRVPKVTTNVAKIQADVRSGINDINFYMNRPSGINSQKNRIIESTPLNKRPDWCEPQDWKYTKELIREKKEEIKKELKENYIPKIKSILLKHLVTSQHSKFGPLLEDGGWIEGVVLRHTRTGKMIKIVDKQVFGVIRKSAWEVRNRLTESAKGIENPSSFMGKLLVNMATSLAHPELGTIHAKNHLRKLGETNEERLRVIAENTHFQSVQKYWNSLLQLTLVFLEEDLDKYEKEAKSLFEGPGGIFARAIRNRTLESFAQTFEKILTLREQTQQAKNSRDLIIILVGKQLNELT